MSDIHTLKQEVQKIKANYRDKIHELRQQENIELINALNSLEAIFPINSYIQKANCYSWFNTTYQVINYDDLYLYYDDNGTIKKIKKDIALFMFIPINNEEGEK